METTLQLVYRNAQLDTELRLVRDQLQQAQIINQYLLGLLTSKADQGLSTALRIPDTPSRNDSVIDLLTLSEDESEPSKAEDSRSGHECRCDHAHRARHGTRVRTCHEREQALHDEAGTTDRAVRLRAPSIGLIDVPRGQGLSKESVNRANDLFSGGPGPTHTACAALTRPLADHEHRRLMGIACFVEAMSPEDRQGYWLRFARNFPGRSAQHWEALYASDIRPTYLEKQRTQQESGQAPHQRVQHARRDVEHVVQSTELVLVNGSRSEAPLGTEDTCADLPKPEPTLTPTQPPNMETEADGPKAEGAAVPDRNDGQVLVSSNESRVCPGQVSASGHSVLPMTNDTGPDGHTPPPLEVDRLFYHGGPGESPAYRTVVVSGVPPETDLATLLQHVSGGSIANAKYLNTNRMRLMSGLLGTDTVLIEYVSPEAAQAFVDSTQGTLSFELDTLLDVVAVNLDVTLLRTETRPPQPWLYYLITNQGFTRMFSTHGSSPDFTLGSVSEELRRIPGFSMPIKTSLDHDGSVHCEFASIAAAAAAGQIIRTSAAEVMKGAQVLYLKDPCNREDGPI